MTTQELHTSFRFELDKLDTGIVPELRTEQVDLALNRALIKYVKQKYRPIKQLIYRNVGFEEIQKRIDDLSEIVITEEVDTIAYDSYTDTSLKVVDLSSITKYMFYLRGTAQVDSVYRPVRVIRQDQLEIVEIDPFNKTSARKPVVYFESGNIIIKLPTNKTISKFRLTYLKMPETINLTGDKTIELKSHTHDEIVQLAASDMLEILESKRVQTTTERTLSVE